MAITTTTPKITLQVFVRMWGNWNPYALLVGIENGAATMESSMEVLRKLSTTRTINDPTVFIPYSY